MSDQERPEWQCAECDRGAWQRGLCSRCYSRQLRRERRESGAYRRACAACGQMFNPDRPTRSVCSISCRAVRANKGRVGKGAKCLQCGAEHFNASYCSRNCRSDASRGRARARRSPLVAAYQDRDYDNVIQMIRCRVTVSPTGCWLWPLITAAGYPQCMRGATAVHRMALEAKHRAPLGVQAAHHMCAITACVNPDHLQPVTDAENMAEMLARKSYVDRIAELEAALAELIPNHALLDRIPMGAAKI